MDKANLPQLVGRQPGLCETSSGNPRYFGHDGRVRSNVMGKTAILLIVSWFSLGLALIGMILH